MSMPMSCLIAMVLLAGAVAAAPWEPEEYPISYWYGPPVEANTRETWQTVRDCNFTVCGPAGGYSVEENRKMLDLCREVGLRALVVDGRIAWQMTAGDRWRETIGKVIADYEQHPALYGYYLQDEPGYELFQALGEVSREFEAQDPAHLPYINLFPTYASVQQLGTPTYADHLDKYLSIVQPRVLSYDHYCLMKDGTDRKDYFENLELIREYGLRYGTPPWNIILSLPHLGYRDPTADEMRWQVYTSLAYGMKGLMYFTYWTHPDWEAAAEIGIVDAQGKPARLYPIIQALNAETRTLGKTLLGLTSTGVYHTGDTPQGCRRLGRDEIVQLPDDVPLVLGLLQDAAGGQHAMVVNRSHRDPADFDVTLKPHVTGVFEVSAQDGPERELPMEDGQVTLTLEPGGGRLLRLQTEFRYAEPPKPVTAIDFGFDTAGDLEGWGGLNSLAEPTVADGVLTLTFTGSDPFLTRTFLRIEPDRYSAVRVRMKLAGGGPEGQLFWTTADEPGFADDKYLNFPITADGEWHEYAIPVGGHAKWKGQAIRAIRLDPAAGAAPVGSKVEIDRIAGE
ncbi:MAG: hypothetical protein FJX74_09915 [Armatimonadetes bacterium]|nr:hypothetical protein [Armatimonadota bacterium]